MSESCVARDHARVSYGAGCTPSHRKLSLEVELSCRYIFLKIFGHYISANKSGAILAPVDYNPLSAALALEIRR